MRARPVQRRVVQEAHRCSQMAQLAGTLDVRIRLVDQSLGLLRKTFGCHLGRFLDSLGDSLGRKEGKAWNGKEGSRLNRMSQCFFGQ